MITFLSVGFLSASVILAYTITPIYRAEGRLLVEKGDITSDIVETTIRGFAEEQIELVRKRVMTAEHVQNIIEEYEIFIDRPITLGEKVRLFRQRSSIVVEQLEDGTMSFIVAYDDEDPVLATAVVARQMELFQLENVMSRTESASSAAEFLESEAARLSVEIADYEIRIAEYKEQNSGRLPEQEMLNMQLLDRAERELEAVEREIRELTQRKAVAEADLLRVKAGTISESGVEPPPGSPERLRYLQSEYLRLSMIYSSEHPDVRRLRREIEILDPNASVLSIPVISEQIRERTAELDDLKNNYSESHPDVMLVQRSLDQLQQKLRQARAATETELGSDPDSVRLLAIVDGLVSEIAAQNVRRDEIRRKIATYERRLMEAPQVQREYLSLTRGYEQLKQKYDDIKLKQTQLELAVSVEEGQRGGRFAITSRASTPTSPHMPNRPALIFLGVLLGVGSGMMIAAILEATNKTVRDAHDVREVWEAPPLVTIPQIRNRSDSKKQKFQIFAYIAILLAMVGGASMSVLG